MFDIDLDQPFVDQLMREYPQLENEEIKALARRARAGDTQARELLILHNLRLVVAETRPFSTPQTFDDAFQEGLKGLIRGVDKYDPELGYTFSTYAVWWIQQAVRIWMYHRWHKVYFPRYAHDLMIRVRKYSSDGNYSAQQIAERAGMDVEDVRKIQAWLSYYYVSMDAPLTLDEGYGSTLADTFCDEEESERITDIEEHDSAKCAVARYLAVLTPQERQVVRMRYGLDGKEYSVADISKELKVTRQRIQQVLIKAMAKMQSATQPMEAATA